MNVLAVALAVTMGLAPAPAADDAWITIDRDVLMAFETGAEPATAEAVSVLEDPLDIRPDVVAAPMTRDRIDELVAFVHENYGRCGGFMGHSSREEAYEAAARAARVRDFELAPAPVSYTIDNGPVVRVLMNAVQEANLRATVTTLSAFDTRYHNCPTGLQSAQWIHALWTGYAAGRPGVTVQYFDHFYNNNPPTIQPSVILTIQGTTSPSEVVVLGAHQDSTVGAQNCAARSPGADDDASGIAVLSEIIRVAMAAGYQPQKTVKFMAYAAEEVGLLGSKQIAQQHQQQGVNVIGVLQFDMTNYTRTPQLDIVMFQDFTHFFQNEFVTSLAALYVPTPGVFPRVTSQCGYGCSDHASWTLNGGFPSSFPFESRFGEHNPKIHTAGDTLERMRDSMLRSVPFTQLGAAYMAELAKGSLTTLAE